jgi:nitroimidazol reductase NimA-like FMN-containing flavoprotein (pyridoxamine 5'-phosphate oxidase superfamily)
MRKANQEITDKSILEEILTSSNICRLGMIDNGLPYILPFNYGFHNNCIYIHSAPTGKKIDLLKENPLVCFEVEQRTDIIENEVACKWSTLYRSVVGYGNVEIVTDLEEKKRGLEIIMAQHGAPEKIEFDRKELEFIVILKLSITTMTGKQSGNWNKIKG